MENCGFNYSLKSNMQLYKRVTPLTGISTTSPYNTEGKQQQQCKLIFELRLPKLVAKMCYWLNTSQADAALSEALLIREESCPPGRRCTSD